MAGINKVILLGRLGKDPEVRNFQNGGKVVKFGLATSERYKDRDGNPQERTEWHDVEIYNDRLGDVAERFLRKGSEVYIEGQIETQTYTDKEGNERKAKRVVLRQFRGELQLVGGRASGGGDAGEERSYGGGERASGNGGGARTGGGGRAGWDSDKKADLDDDIPF